MTGNLNVLILPCTIFFNFLKKVAVKNYWTYLEGNETIIRHIELVFSFFNAKGNPYRDSFCYIYCSSIVKEVTYNDE